MNNQFSSIARMRTINEAIAYIKSSDPQTAFNSTALRRMVKNREIPCVNAGNKYLVNLDVLIAYLNNPLPSAHLTETTGAVKIRKI